MIMKNAPSLESTVPGKTTLLRIITGESAADSGEVVFSKDTSFGYLRQQEKISSDNTIYEEIASAKSEYI